VVCIEMKLVVGVGVPSKSSFSLPVLIFKIRHPATSRVLGFSFNRGVVIIICLHPLQLCQYDSTYPPDAVSLGGIQNISWSVTSEDEFTLTITGGSPAYGPNRARCVCALL